MLRAGWGYQTLGAGAPKCQETSIPVPLHPADHTALCSECQGWSDPKWLQTDKNPKKTTTGDAQPGSHITIYPYNHKSVMQKLSETPSFGTSGMDPPKNKVSFPDQPSGHNP